MHDDTPSGREDTSTAGEPVVFVVPDRYRSLVPGEEAVVALDPRTLELTPVEKEAVSGEGSPDRDRLPASFPSDPDAALSLALLLGLLDEIAIYRSEITTLLEDIEAAGVDPLLVLSRLATDPDLEPRLDLDVRRRQLEQLL